MLKRMPTHYGDETCASCAVAGDYIFLAHHTESSIKPGLCIDNVMTSIVLTNDDKNAI